MTVPTEGPSYYLWIAYQIDTVTGKLPIYTLKHIRNKLIWGVTRVNKFEANYSLSQKCHHVIAFLKQNSQYTS